MRVSFHVSWSGSPIAVGGRTCRPRRIALRQHRAALRCNGRRRRGVQCNLRCARHIDMRARSNGQTKRRRQDGGRGCRRSGTQIATRSRRDPVEPKRRVARTAPQEDPKIAQIFAGAATGASHATRRAVISFAPAPAPATINHAPAHSPLGRGSSSSRGSPSPPTRRFTTFTAVAGCGSCASSAAARDRSKNASLNASPNHQRRYTTTCAADATAASVSPLTRRPPPPDTLGVPAGKSPPGHARR